MAALFENSDSAMHSRYGQPMFRKGLLIFCLLVTSLMTATVVHAQEFAGTSPLECSGEVHSQQDEQPSSGDAEKGVAHHHGCHSVSSFLSAADSAPDILAPSANLYSLARADILLSLRVGPDLRPPIT